jgi:2',3'-cyclic-nucleotide 2'-phosphodiesterase (5'-nucleotidase family)
VVSHLKGLDAVIDGHSHQAYHVTVPDAEGKAIPLAQTGSYFQNVGRMILGADGSIDIDIISEVPAPQTWMAGIEATEVTRGGRTRWVDSGAHEFLEAIADSYNAVMSRLIGTSAFDLDLHAGDSARSSLCHENGLCELVADAFREHAETDISIINAASVRNSLPAGEISFNTLLNVLPYSDNVMIARLSGQTILDVLEFGCRKMPKTCSGFPQVSGLEYTVDTTIDSSVVTDEKGDFIGVDGARRVRDVSVGGKPINPERLYTIATTSFFLEGGDNYKMLAENAEIIGSTEETDNIVLADYIIYDLDGEIPASYLRKNRVKEVTEASVP